MDLSKKIFGSNIDPEIQEYFKNLQKGTFDIQPGDSLSDTSFDSSTQTYLGDRTPYARMWTAVNVVSVQKDPDNPSKFKPIGNGKNSVYIVNDNSFNSYESSELDSVSELGNNSLLKPAAGVTEVTSRAEGSLGALRRTVVKFVVHNKEDFDKTFLPFFLKPGSHIFVDFGWSDKAFSLYDPNDFINNTDLEMGNFYDTIYNDDDKIKSGFTTTVSGQVIKYDVNINQNQSFECTLEFVSSNYQLLDKEVSEDNNLKFIFTNVLEDLILLKYLNSSDKGSEIVKNELSQQYLWREIPREQRSKNIKEFFDRDYDYNPSQPLINRYSKKIGIFYQNFTSNSNSSINQKESLYISFAVFEDDFLNNYVATTVKKDNKGNVISENVDKTPNMPKFNSRNTYIRWDENLFNMMRIKPRSHDKTLSFLYPDTWDVEETSNKYKPNIIAEKGKEREWRGTADDKKKRRIPLRELFIRTTIIIEAFEASSNINDALERIFDNIFEDSGNLINIRVMKNNDFESSLTFHDVNIEPIEKKPNDTFKFDITSGNTIVQNVDLKFETPKAGLSSMIAIGGLSTPNIFDDFQLMRFNILNAIQSDGLKKQIRHMPIFGESTTTEKHIDIDLTKILSSSPSDVTGLGALNITSDYNDYKKRRKKTYEELTKKKLDIPLNPPLLVFDDTDDRQVFTANSERDIELINAKINTFIKTDANSISPVLPISLTLEIYGNNFLNIGDYFTINFLPEHFKERVYFQIVGVDHSISTSNWKTTYNTVMRPYSTEKFRQFGNTKDDDLAILGDRVKVIFSGGFLEQVFDEFRKSTPSDFFNIHQKYMARLFEISQQQTLRHEVKDDIDSVFVKHYRVKYDVKKDEDLIKPPKLKTELINNNNKYITMAHNPFPAFTVERLCWLIAMSNLLLGDEVIDWEKFKYNNKSKAKLRDAGGEKYKLERRTGENGLIWVGSLLKYDGQESIFPPNVNASEALLLATGYIEDENRGNYFKNTIFQKAQASVSTNYKRIYTLALEKFLFHQDQTISDSIKKPTYSNYSNKPDFDSYLFLNKLDIPLINQGYNETGESSVVNEFQIMYFTDNEAVKSFPLLQIPKYLLKVSVLDFSKLLWDNYKIKLSEALKVFPSETLPSFIGPR